MNVRRGTYAFLLTLRVFTQALDVLPVDGSDLTSYISVGAIAMSVQGVPSTADLMPAP